MPNLIQRRLRQFLPFATLVALLCGVPMTQAMTVPHSLEDGAPVAKAQATQSIVLAGGCFWGMQAVFQHTKGVTAVTVGYAGGEAATAHYEMVGTGRTGHAESVRVTYDPAQVSLEQILKVFFLVAHHPTQLDYQGPDIGTQYRSAIFAATPEQQKIAADTILHLKQAKAFSAPIVTQIEPLKVFYAAEAYHQNYAQLHPDMPYVRVYDLPKVAALQKKFPELYAAP